MSAAEPVIELTRAWWQRAAEDLEAAKTARHLTTTCAFHCQQAVEKGIKCLLVYHQKDFGKTHDIGALLNLLGVVSTTPPPAIGAGLKELTRFAVETRYPPRTATAEEAKNALAKAESFLL